MRISVSFLGFLVLQRAVAAFSSQGASKVVVTGASGKTGRLVWQALVEHGKFDPKALVRSQKSAQSLRKNVPATRLDQIVVCDVTTLSENDAPADLEGLDAMVICTSAMPTISKVSLLKAFLKAPINLIRGRKAMDFRSLKFVWKKGQFPEKVRDAVAPYFVL
jgi:glutamyl-tRNA reductase